MTLTATACFAVACGSRQTSQKPEASAVAAVPTPTELVSLLTMEMQDGLATAPDADPCITKISAVAPAPATALNQVADLESSNIAGTDFAMAMGAPKLPDAGMELWHYEVCAAETSGVFLSGERRLWGRDAGGTAPLRSRFTYARTREDGARWDSEGQVEQSARTEAGQVTEHRALMHGSLSPAGERIRNRARHVYAYHLRITEGLDGAAGKRLSGVAQLNFATLEATTQVRLTSLIMSPECPWPVSGHVSVATTAGDGSFLDTALLFTAVCGVVKDDRGSLTTLTMPWEEGA